jgi:hypothetical protein
MNPHHPPGGEAIAAAIGLTAALLAWFFFLEWLRL